MSHKLHLRSLQKFRRQLHATAFKPVPPVSTAIQAFCCQGQIRNAINLFDEMPHKNIFSYSAMIHGYAINGCYLDSLSLFRRMQHSQIRPNTYTFVAVLLASAGLNNPILAGCIHGITAKIGIESDSFVTTALLSSYSKCGAAAEAYRLFRETENPGIASWNAIIAGFANNQRFDEGFSLFERLRKEGVKPNCITMVIVAQICTDCCWASLETCESIHGYVVKIGLESDLGLMNSVLDMYTSFNSSNMAEIFFKKMKTRDAITWTNMMGFMLKLNRPTESLQLFSQMTACGINGDSITLINVISACTLSIDLAKGKTVHTRIITLGFGSEIQISNALITMYSRCGCVNPARTIFNQIPSKTLISWTAMMFGYTYNNKPKDSINLFINLIREKQPLNVDPITLISPLLSSTNLSNLQLSKQLHSFISKSGFLPQSILLQNTLIAAYGRSGEPDLAASIFNEMIIKDIVSWNAMISSYGINGKGEAALRVFQQMDRSGDSITFVNVLSACSHSGMVTEGLKVFEKMVKEERIRARGEHYGCVADLLSRGGRLEEVKKLGEAVTGELGLSVWKAVLGGSGIEGDLGMAEVAAEKVFGMVVGEEGEGGGGGFVALLANVYAGVGRFEWAEGLRDGGMGKRKKKKKIGFSWVDGFVEDDD